MFCFLRSQKKFVTKNGDVASYVRRIMRVILERDNFISSSIYINKRDRMLHNIFGLIIGALY